MNLSTSLTETDSIMVLTYGSRARILRFPMASRGKKLRGLLNAVLRLAAVLVHDLFLRVTDR